jgi:hypothetical protein
MVYACPAWKYAAEAVDTHLLKLQRLQNPFLHGTGNSDMRKPVREMHLALTPKIAQNHVNPIQSNAIQLCMQLYKEKPRKRSTGGLNFVMVRRTPILPFRISKIS